MATSDGLFGIFQGRLGNKVGYMLNGKNVIRLIGKNNRPPSLAQLTVRQKMAVSVKFLRPILPLINAGFELEARNTGKSPHNLAVSYHTKNATTGEYPNISLDYSKAMISVGILEPAINPAAKLIGNTLSITWSVSPEMSWGIKNDRTILLVYCPETNKTICILSGAMRSTGKDEIELPASFLNHELHTYISFTAIDRKSVANSVYVKLC